ncbi:5'-nucleotidase C-terminal domain-containing protein [Rothia nasimurium]|uniref:5'-nucleotidase C-terminal domain-containing protein n=1 Tax=Rothia nasimurium TaxID=85336 RepID=UPI001F007B37|nr:5'-nucleotidase C-terminal domain-containing protein [Rothia nasimurium]
MKRSLSLLAGLGLVSSSILVPAAFAADGTTDLGDLTVLASTDVHGRALNYDYFTGAPYGEGAKALGMEHLATAIAQTRAAKGTESTLVLDNGDANQGNPLQTYYQNNRTATSVDPMASVFNLLGYDAGVVGNHEFNYGPDAASQYTQNLTMPLLGANVIDTATGAPAYEPYTMIEKTVGGEKIQVAVIGVVTPGVRVWDKATVEGKLEFKDAAATVAEWAPKVKAAGADVVVVLAHTGLDAEGYTYNPADLTENVAKSVAEQSTDVDLVVGGHSHVTNKVQEYFTNKNGEPVLYTQPGYWARFLSEVTLPLVKEADGDIEVKWTEDEKPTALALNAGDYAADPSVLAAIEPYHSKTTEWVQTVVAQASAEMPAASSAWEDTAVLDFINMVQTEEVTRALTGTQYEGLPVIAEASPFSRTAVFKQGDVTIADMASLYIYDNTLYAVELTGAQLKDYLEWSARYYKQQEPGAEITDWSTVTNALYEGATRGIPDYSYDVLSGVNYHINISKPVGERIEGLILPDGTALADDQKVILALNNYRWSGGSGYPHVTAAPIVYEEQKAVRDLMIDWAITNKTIDPATFFVKNWTVGTSSLPTEQAPEETPAPAPSASPTAAPSAEPTVAPTEEPTASPSADAPAPSPSDSPASSASANTSQSSVAGARETGKSGILAHTGATALPLLAGAALLLGLGATAFFAARRKNS